MRASGRGLTSGRERLSFQRLLVAGQIAISLVLLVGALLMAQSFRNLMSVDPGFRQAGILVVFVDMSGLPLPAARHPTLPSRLIPRSRCASTANSIGSSLKTCLQKPLTIIDTASSADSPRCRA